LQYILKMLANMAEHSTRGFAFNLLTSYVDWKEPHLFYGDPSFFFDHCVRNISRRVVVFHDYPLYEWTIGVRL
ncbi:MAG TPA: class I SAM-dependent methyltransferase, partial [Thermoanaerobaculia bacterium]|nr:class I SAM-dependent methyltransferase [Thermoanaerobaculia bacterium]